MGRDDEDESCDEALLHPSTREGKGIWNIGYLTFDLEERRAWISRYRDVEQRRAELEVGQYIL